ncbi:hypothetical protein BU23DRAFT_310675 [Bimuria novae-zelandiae CBS 107.79]|uniref:Uncharacterized protein n=1 Tax=Bimuria novae-zelandiae CBS 107.79 TaxID=1447943 RepID=A0A6A5UQC0_9PLEO|nr:hypothetical protein BU23DRAFT_310675 [Bimuria novae-zelandiae CBS 107.79]
MPIGIHDFDRHLKEKRWVGKHKGDRLDPKSKPIRSSKSSSQHSDNASKEEKLKDSSLKRIFKRQEAADDTAKEDLEDADNSGDQSNEGHSNDQEQGPTDPDKAKDETPEDDPLAGEKESLDKGSDPGSICRNKFNNTYRDPEQIAEWREVQLQAHNYHTKGEHEVKKNIRKEGSISGDEYLTENPLEPNRGNTPRHV